MSLAPTSQPMSEDEARRITERIRSLVIHTRESIEKVQRLLTEARDGGAHIALGYDESEWTRYMADLFADQPLRLPRDQRKELVGYLAGEGMTSRAIAPIVGTTDRQTRRDIAGGTNVPPALTDEPGRVTKVTGPGSAAEPHVNTGTGEVSEDYDAHGRPREDYLPDATAGEEVTTSGGNAALQRGPEAGTPGGEVEPPTSSAPSRPAVTGLDGKTYPQREQSKPKRAPITDAFWRATYDLQKITERIERLQEDDRFARNKHEVATKNRGHLVQARKRLDALIQELDN